MTEYSSTLPPFIDRLAASREVRRGRQREPPIHRNIDESRVRRGSCFALLIVAFLTTPHFACTSTQAREPEGEHEAKHPIVVTSPVVQDVETARQFVCQIRSRRHIELRALQRGYLQDVLVQEGQALKKGQLMFKILPVVYRAKLQADQAELESAEITLRNTKMLFEKNVVSDQELALATAERQRAKARVELAQAELAFTEIRAPFDGIMDRLHEQEGSLLEEGDMLTNVSDNSLMWVYFNVPEADYLEFMAVADAEGSKNAAKLHLPDARITVQLANGTMFEESAGDTVTVESEFDNETGNILFRADLPNPKGLLRHGQTGTLWIHRKLEQALVIPQRATFEVLDKLYVYVVGEDGVVRQRAITVSHEMDDIFVVESGLGVDDRIVLDGVRQVHDGEHVHPEFRDPGDVLASLKVHAE